MLNGKRILAMIPARGGSKGLPGKNIRPLGGRPLIAWTIDAALGSRIIDHLVLSSDSAAIIRVAQEHGCDAPFIRPADLSTDSAPGLAPAKHCVQMLPGYDYLVILQPTSPFRSSEDIDRAIQTCIDANAASLVSVTKASQHPSWMSHIDKDGRLSHITKDPAPTRRQDLSPVYALNGAIYVVKTNWLHDADSLLDADTLAFSMPEQRSIDIDTALDFRIAEMMAQDILSGRADALYQGEKAI